MSEDNISVAILLSNGNIPKDIFTSSVDEYFGPQVEDFKESSLSVCILSEKTGLIPSKQNAATFVKSQWLFLTNFPPNQIFEFSLIICENQSWKKILSEDSADNRLIQTFNVASDKAIVVHLEWNKPHTVSEESLMELLSMDESLIKSHYENLETSESFKNLETITEDNNDEESLLDSLQEEPGANKINDSDTDDSLESGAVNKIDHNSNVGKDVEEFRNSAKKVFDPVKEKLNADHSENVNLENEIKIKSGSKDLANLENNDLPKLENKEMPDLKNEKVVNLENEEVPRLENEEIANVKNEEVPKSENKEVTKVEDDEVPKLENEDVSKLQNEEVANIENEEVPNFEDEQIPKLENKEVSKLQNEEAANVENEEIPKSENKEIPKLKNEGLPISENENIFSNDNGLKELISSDEDIVINNAGKLHERVNFMSFVEEPSPLITEDKEQSANETIYSNNKQLHGKEIQSIIKNEIRSYDSEISDLNVNESVESLKNNSEKSEVISAIRNDNSDPVQYSENSDENIIKMEEPDYNEVKSNENINLVEEDNIEESHLRASNLNNHINYAEENVLCENISYLNEDILENPNFTQTVTPQFVSCVLESSYGETHDILSLEQPNFAIENTHIDCDKLTAIQLDVNPLSKSQIESHSSTNVQNDYGLEEASENDKIKIKEDEISICDTNKILLTEPLNLEITEPISLSNEVLSTDHVVLNQDKVAAITENLKLLNDDTEELNKNYDESESKTKINDINNSKIFGTDESEIKIRDRKIISKEILKINKISKAESENQTEPLTVSSEVYAENIQPRVSDIIERFETFTVKSEKTNKSPIDKEKENKRISDIVKLYEDINLNKEDLNKNHTNKNEMVILEKKETTLDIKQKDKKLSPNKDKNITIKIPDSKNILVSSTPYEEKDIPTGSQAELRVNDDYKYPDSVTPTKVEQGLSKLTQYDVLFIDDDVFYKENWYKESNNRWTTLEKSKIINNENSLTPASEVPMKNTPKASLETLNDSEIEKIKVSIDSAEPVRKKKGIMNLCGCVGGRKRS